MTREYFEAISHKSLVDMAVILQEQNEEYVEIFKEFSERTCNNCKHYSIKEGHQPDGLVWKFEECAIYSAVVPELLDYEGCTKWECEDA